MRRVTVAAIALVALVGPRRGRPRRRPDGRSEGRADRSRTRASRNAPSSWRCPTNGGSARARSHVFENGDTRLERILVPVAPARRGDFGVVLVIDASNSMKGSPHRGRDGSRPRIRGVGAQPISSSRSSRSTARRRSLLPFTTDADNDRRRARQAASARAGHAPLRRRGNRAPADRAARRSPSAP